jgi:selenocysteine lyase/cysteine desulfurase
VEIRGADGRLRDAAEIDREAAASVQAAVTRGAFALLHVLDASKTGRPGVSREAARRIVARYPEQALVVVDACQLRCSAAQVRADLDDGFAVMITGSKFAGGPSFCGAILLPPGLVERLQAGKPTVAALADYSAALDWPAALRPAFAAPLRHPANLGLGLRWTAALAEIEAYEAIPAADRAALVAAFDAAVRERVAATPGLALLDPDAPIAAPGLTPIVHADGSDPRSTYEALQRPSRPGVRPCHLGQPVTVGERTALRVCASMPMIAEAAASGMAPLLADLDHLFDAWAALRQVARTGG